MRLKLLLSTVAVLGIAASTLAQAQNAGLYASGGTPVTLAQSGVAGQGQPVPTMSPYLTIIWCIATQGAFPPRP